MHKNGQKERITRPSIGDTLIIVKKHKIIVKNLKKTAYNILLFLKIHFSMKAWLTAVQGLVRVLKLHLPI